MKTPDLKTKWIIITIVFVMIATVNFAQNGKDSQKSPKAEQEQVIPAPPLPPVPPPPPPPPPPSPQGLEPMNAMHPPQLELPDLTNDQLEKIKKMDLKDMEQMTPLRNLLEEKRARLTTILATAPVNLKDAEAVADEIGKTEASMLKQQIRHDQDIRTVLTPDQQIIFDSRPKPFLNNKIPDRRMQGGKRH